MEIADRLETIQGPKERVQRMRAQVYGFLATAEANEEKPDIVSAARNYIRAIDFGLDDENILAFLAIDLPYPFDNPYLYT